MAYNLAESFAADNIQVISGLAAGIDAAAHRGCLASGGYTYAVLGCGTDVCYPYENLDIYKNIIILIYLYLLFYENPIKQ